MGDDDTPRQRQENEFQVIKAIFVGDVEEEGPLSPSVPIRFKVRLLPQRGSSGGGVNYGKKAPTYLVVHVSIPSDYPESLPDLEFGESKGLSMSELAELEGTLKKMAERAKGQEMMYQLLQKAETFLYTHQKLVVGSFHDEMIKRQKQLEEKTLKLQLDMKEKERMAIKEEILRKQKEEREELRKLKGRRVQIAPMEDRTSPKSSPVSSPMKGDGFGVSLRSHTGSKRLVSAGRRRTRSTSEGSDSSNSESSELTLLEFVSGKTTHLFYCGEVLGKSERGTTVYAGMSRNGGLVAIMEWKFVAELDKKGKEVQSRGSGAGDCITLDSVSKLIHNYESEMNLLQKLEHPNIVLYFGMKGISIVDEPGTLTVYLAQEFVRGTTLRSYIEGTHSVDVALIRHCAKGILDGLQYLHQCDVVHRFLRDTSIFLEPSGLVRMTDYGIERKICELHQSFHGFADIPDRFPPPIGRGGKKGDIHRFGVIILSLVLGHYAQEPLEVPSSLPEELQDFLRKCLTPLEHHRWTAKELLAHSFLKLPLNSEEGKILRLKQPDSPVKTSEEQDDEEDDPDDIASHLPNLFKGHSRVQSEFDILKFLGKGGFGDVLKARNKLDGRVYALKRIKLNPKNKQLNRKITREVKLLSQMNHENVVRYFNSWIETVIESDDETSASTTDPSYMTKPNGVSFAKPPRTLAKNNHNSLGLVDNIEELARSIRETSEWDANASYKEHATVYSEESEDSSDDDDLFGTSFRQITMEESDPIVFQYSTSQSVDKALENEENGVALESQKPIPSNSNSSISLSGFLRESQFLYIQMEFCEKSTLRTAIDNNLCEDLDRAWRLFREIVEGLVHIHQQGMIHRDLKPVNIFLDSNDHVKIGDFGLATSSIIQKRLDEAVQDGDGAQSMDFTDDSRTGQVGTALYVAPELIVSGQKASYNQKVDIYSLGIMFFEMFYHAPGTGMERVRVISGLRQNDITFPKDFDQSVFPQVTHITKWLLNHDHTKRPTSLELLQSDYLPPPVLEEAELRDIFSRTLRSSKTKAYKYLVASCFQQQVAPIEDAIYDMDERKSVLSTSTTTSGSYSKSLVFIQKVKRVISKVFERHGAAELQTPLLMPKTSLYAETENCVNLMNHGGNLVSIPHDLRVPFARYVGRHGISHFKRYTIDKVFRERKVFGWHPRELIECAFDIVEATPGRLMADAEVLYVVFEIMRELPWLSNRNCTIRLGHTKLLRGFMLHHGVDEKHYDKIAKLLSETRNERDSKQQIHTHLCSLGLSDHFITTFLHLMDVEGSFSKVSNILKGITKRKGEAASYVTSALHELEILIGNLDFFGLKCNITVAPTMTFCAKIYSGVLFQVVCDLKRRKNKMMVDIVAAGGRYDALIQQFRAALYFDQDSPPKNEAPCGVGVSISLDKLISSFEVDEENDNIPTIPQSWIRQGCVDVLIIFGLGHHIILKEKIDMMKELWSRGIRASIVDETQTFESAEELCKDVGASFLIIIKDGEYNVRVRVWEQERFDEKKMSKTEAIEFITKSLDMTIESTCATNSKTDTSKTATQQSSSETSSTTHSVILPPYNVTVFIQEREKIAHIRRKYENQIMSRLSDVLHKIEQKQSVEILGLEVPSSVINHLASTLSLHNKEEYSKNVADIVEKNLGMRKYLKGVCDEIFDLMYEKNTSVLILYGLVDNSYRVLV